MASLIRLSFRALVLVLAVGGCAELPTPPPTETVASQSAPSPKSDPQPAPEPGDAVPTRLPLKLLGTMTSSDPGLSLATVYEDTTQHSRTVWTGSTIQGAKVLAVERTRLLLSNKDRVEFLEITPGSADPRGAASPSPSAAPASSPATAPMAFGATLQQTGPDTYVIQRSDVENMRAHLKELAAQGERKQAFRGGHWLGIRVVSLSPDSIWERVGLKQGDILVTANGWSLGMPPHELRVFTMLKTIPRLDLDIERDGQIIRKTYILQD